MRIRHFSFMGIRGLDGLRQDWPRSKDTDLIVVHGGFAKGKTSFLDTLAASKETIAEYGSPDLRWDSLVGSSAGSAKVLIDWEPSDTERARMAINETLLSSESILGKAKTGEYSVTLQGLLGHGGDAQRGSMHYLHDTRELDAPLSYGADDASVRNRLTTRNSKFSEIYDMLDQPERAAARALGAARFSELFPKLEIMGLRRSGTSFYPIIRHRETGATRYYDTLSWSERQAFLIALYTARMPIFDSILMVDAPELGFGDNGAAELVRGLLRWTERTQIIVATSSDAVRAMPEAAHVLELPS